MLVYENNNVFWLVASPNHHFSLCDAYVRVVYLRHHYLIYSSIINEWIVGLYFLFILASNWSSWIFDQPYTIPTPVSDVWWLCVHDGCVCVCVCVWAGSVCVYECVMAVCVSVCVNECVMALCVCVCVCVCMSVDGYERDDFLCLCSLLCSLLTFWLFSCRLGQDRTARTLDN